LISLNVSSTCPETNIYEIRQVKSKVYGLFCYCKEKEHFEQEKLAYIRNNITSFVQAERSIYQYSSLGGIYGLNIIVQNRADYIIDKVIVKVSYLKSSGEVWKEKLEEFYYIEPWETSTSKMLMT